MADNNNEDDYRHDRYYPTATLPWSNPGWGQQAASTAINGETQDLVDHCAKIFAEKNNTSVDKPWWVHRYWNIADAYTLLILVICLVPIMAIFWIPLFVCLLPPVLINRVYIGYLVPEAPCNVIPRNNNCGLFQLHCLLQFLLAIPAMILAIWILLYSHIVMFVFGMPYLVVGSLLQCRWPTQRLYHNLQVLKPYQGGPSLLWHFPDIVVAVMGSVYRQNFFEFMFSFTNMFFINPWCKYWLYGNLYTCDLGERFLTQIGQAMDDMDPHAIDTHAMNAISRAKHTPINREEIDQKMFAPHYPYPPPNNNRRYAIGMQHASLMTTWVHTTHFRTAAADNDTNEIPIASLSHSALLPIYRVMLWRNNPYHIYTGYVEANISTGLPSQPEKKYSMEHPMWLINSHNKLAADRNLAFSLGQIDTFFDSFIPQFNHYIRLNVRGRDVADQYLARDKRMGYEALHFKYQKMAEV